MNFNLVLYLFDDLFVNRICGLTYAAETLLSALQIFGTPS